MHSGLYVITDAALRPDRSHVDIVRAVLAGGARIVQLRDRSSPLSTVVAQGREIRRLTREAGALFIVNDRVDVALACDADGVHLGLDDIRPEEARLLLSADGIIGVSVNSIEEAQAAESAGADYIGVGAIFGTATKSDAGAPIGLERLREIKRATTLPVVAIGGISLKNLRSVAEAGADAAAVVSAVVCAEDMVEATRNLLNEFHEGKQR
jgi:thiamine-phosphate pyrophosphorylase